MISLAQDHSAASATVYFAGTREDFARALISLGAGIEADHRGAASGRARRVLLGCSYQRWLSAVGQVPELAHHAGPGGLGAFQIWEYRCDDGSVCCLGRRQRHETDGMFVSVRAVFLPPPGGLPDDFRRFQFGAASEG